MNSEISMKRWLWLVAVCIAAFFVSSGALNSDIMESRNLVTAHEMVTYDNWLIPTMNGNLRLEKPPLPTWVAGGIEIIAGESLVAQRAAAGVMGALWALFFLLTVDVVCRRRNVAVMSTLIFLTCYNVVLMGRTATWDIYCHAFMQGALWLLFRIYYGASPLPRGRRWGAYIGAGVLMGLSFLSKGPVSFFALLLPFIVACAFLGRRPSGGSAAGVVTMIIVTIAVSAWWYVYIYYFHTDLATAVLHKESGAWVNHNVRPFWYYWRYFLETGVWALLTLAALLTPLFYRTLRRNSALRFAVIWMFATVVLLSLLPEKKMRYLLPVMAPCSMSVGLLLAAIADQWQQWRAGRIIFRVNGWFVTAVTALLAGGVIYMWLAMDKVDAPVAVAAAVLILGVAVLMGRSVKKGNVIHFVDSVALLFVVAECLLMSQITHFFVNPEMHSLRGVRTVGKVQDLPFYITDADPIRMELVQAAGRRIRPLDFTNADSVIAAMPCVVLTRKPVAETFPAEVLEVADTIYIDTYDDNRHPATDRHYTDWLRNRVTILKRK